MPFVPIDISVLSPGQLQLASSTAVDPTHVIAALQQRSGPRLVLMPGKRPRASFPFRVRVTVSERGIVARFDRKSSKGTRELDLATLRGALEDAVLRQDWRRAA